MSQIKTARPTHSGVTSVFMLGLTVALLAVSTWAAKRNKQFDMGRLYPPIVV